MVCTRVNEYKCMDRLIHFVGIFKQEIIDGHQVEVPDYWLDFNPWEFPRHDIVVDIMFYGYVRKQM